MARKKRRFDQAPLPQQDTDPKNKPRYRDPFQEKVGTQIEELGRRFEGQGRNILYGLGALAVLGIIIWIIYVWSGRSTAEAQAALGKAIEISQASVTDIPPMAGTDERTFKTHKERAEAAIAEFNSVAEKYGGAIGEKARYFIATNRLFIDRAAGIQELEEISSFSGETGTLAKFALAQALADDGKFDEAAALYQELSGKSDPVIAKETIDHELALIYEKQGKTQEAADLLFELVKTASERKDMQGKDIPLSNTARNAKRKLEEIAPEKAKELPETIPDSPFGGMPIGF
jgi:tetratricopeptide (TPR) repeat protein